MIRKFFNRKNNFKSLGKNIEINSTNKFLSPENISIGDNVYIGPDGMYIGHGGIEINSGTIIAHNVEITTRNHNYDGPNLKSIPYDNEYVYKKVIIGENVWIGSHVKITPGVIIGEGSVIGMGSVVTKEVPVCAVVAGNPAKIIKYRDIDKYNFLKEKNKIYLKEKKNDRKK